MKKDVLKGKKLLVLGGVYQHCKLVEAAHELGVYVIVDDYLPPEQAPAKQIAEKYYMHNITDYDDIHLSSSSVSLAASFSSYWVTMLRTASRISA